MVTQVKGLENQTLYDTDVEGVKWAGILLQLTFFARPLPHKKLLATGQANIFINIRIGMIIRRKRLTYEWWTPRFPAFYQRKSC